MQITTIDNSFSKRAQHLMSKYINLKTLGPIYIGVVTIKNLDDLE